MLLRLLNSHLFKPHRQLLVAVFILQLIQTLATLYLPTLNADIIDKGVVPRRYGLHLADRRCDARRRGRAGRFQHRRHLLRLEGRGRLRTGRARRACSIEWCRSPRRKSLGSKLRR